MATDDALNRAQHSYDMALPPVRKPRAGEIEYTYMAPDNSPEVEMKFLVPWAHNGIGYDFGASKYIEGCNWYGKRGVPIAEKNPDDAKIIAEWFDSMLANRKWIETELIEQIEKGE
jgi:hypothetical protein